MKQWMLAAILVIICGIMTLSACSNNDNAVKPDTSALDNWQAGRKVTADAVKAFGGLDKCFAAEPIPDGVWARMQGKTYKENPHIGRDDLRHVRALHWDYDNQMHVGEMVCNKVIADRVATILRQLFDAKYPIQRMLLPDVYDADDETQMRDNNSSCFCYRNIAGSTNSIRHKCRNIHYYYNKVLHLDETDLILSTLWAQIDVKDAYMTERCLTDFHRIMYGEDILTFADFNREQPYL